MIDLTIKAKKKSYKLKCPGNWNEVTVKQFIGLEFWDGKDVLQLLSILTGLDVDIIANSDSSTKDKIGEVVAFIYDNPPDFNKLKRKKYIIIGGKPATCRHWIFWKKTKIIGGTKVKMPTSLEMETYGQTIMVEQILNNDKDKEVKGMISEIMAIYVQPKLDGKFIESRVEEIKPIIDEMPIIIVYPHCFFFFKKLLKYKRTGLMV